MTCSELPRTEAYFDREIDALSAADLEGHIGACVECQALLRDLDTERKSLRALEPHTAPPELRARILLALDEEASVASPPVTSSRRPEKPAHLWQTRPFWLGAFGGMGGTAVAALLAVFLIVPVLNRGMLDDLVAAHVRSLMPDHLIDVMSTDHHTVKPWFAGHADVSPVVMDFTTQGYRLIGGRADYLDHQRSAVVVYQHGAHTINVFSWSDQHPALPKTTTRSGYRIMCWQVKDLQYCAVSDTGWDELQGLVTLLQDASARDDRG
jgi:anti-sigma factor RsiW